MKLDKFNFAVWKMDICRTITPWERKTTATRQKHSKKRSNNISIVKFAMCPKINPYLVREIWKLSEQS